VTTSSVALVFAVLPLFEKMLPHQWSEKELRSVITHVNPRVNHMVCRIPFVGPTPILYVILYIIALVVLVVWMITGNDLLNNGMGNHTPNNTRAYAHILFRESFWCSDWHCHVSDVHQFCPCSQHPNCNIYIMWFVCL
jgi:hypothetical protein